MGKGKRKRKPVAESVSSRTGECDEDSDDQQDEFNPQFNFDFHEDASTFAIAKNSAEITSTASSVVKTSTDILIANALVRRKELLRDHDDEEMEVDDEEFEEVSGAAEQDVLKLKNRNRRDHRQDGSGIKEEYTAVAEFADEICSADPAASESFLALNLSRPLLRGVAALGWQKPTPIQAACVPLALQGRDICACARTGSGKTAAFLLPSLERLLYKPAGGANVTRVLVLSPTRELAVQIHGVAESLTRYSPSLAVSLSAGGMDLRGQEASLRLGPDVVIATPGRLIDHLHNAPNFHLGNIEILILDEADKLVDEYFIEQLKEIVRLCSKTRQTLLFSATMTDDVKELASVSLRRPVKLFLNSNTEVALRLSQEFVRVRAKRECDREALVAALVKRTFNEHCLVFLPTKKLCHRMHILLGLLGVNCGELHSNLSQQQRLDTLEKFMAHEIDVLLATDLASRGLDIEDVATVMNYSLPSTLKQYVHRAGRTARAGRKGRVVSLVGEEERSLLKEIVRRAPLPVRMRVVPSAVLAKYSARLAALQPEFESIEIAEREEREARAAQQEINRVQRSLEGADADGQSRKRNWYKSNAKREQMSKSKKINKFCTV